MRLPDTSQAFLAAVAVFPLVWASAPGAASAEPQEVPAKQAEQWPAIRVQDDVQRRATALLAQMTLEEKVGQLVQYFDWKLPPTAAGKSSTAIDVEAAIAKGQVGSMLLVSDPVRANELQRIAVTRSRLKIPLLFGYDVIHGLHTIMPVPLALAASWDPETAQRAQTVAAAEARAVGIDWTFAPMVDITQDPRWGRFIEGAGEDPTLGSAMAAAQVRGFQGAQIGASGHILAEVKHFVGYGASVGGRDYDEVNLSEEQMRNVYFKPFKAAIDAGVAGIMSAYMQINGVPASANRRMLTDILRKELGFRGFVSSDANGANSLVRQGAARDLSEAAVRTLEAGTDMAMSAPTSPSPMLSLTKAVRSGRVAQSTVDDAVRRILEAKFRMGLFEHPYVNEKAAAGILADPGHREVARTAAERSAVLLANSGGALPLNGAALKSLAVIGPFADSSADMLGPWVFTKNAPQAISVFQGLRKKLGARVAVQYAPGVAWPTRHTPSFFDAMNQPGNHPPIDPKQAFAQALDLVKASDATVLVMGEALDMEGESASRSALSLPGDQQALLDAAVATGKPVILVLIGGRPFNLAGASPGAILDAWYPGSEGGSAIANLLLGDAVPGGKLPFSWIRSAGQLPYTYAYLPSHQPAGESRRYWDEDNAPTWPFGFGLSYTTFAYSKLVVDRAVIKRSDTVTVSFDLTNTGKRAGDEVAQLYIHQQVGMSSRPVRELKRFARVTLQPGETRHMQFTVTPDDRRYWSDATQGWVQDDSAFDVWVGGNSQASMHTQFKVAD